MAEILMVRHAKSLANKRDFTVFGNQDSPLDSEKGIKQAEALKQTFRYFWGIDPGSYERPVLTSKYARTKQTANVAGFRRIVQDAIINESVIRPDVDPADLIAKHAQDRWVPEETADRAARFVSLVREGRLTHQVYFSHGLFIAGVMLHLAQEAEAADEQFGHPFSDKRGFIPNLATIVPLEI